VDKSDGKLHSTEIENQLKTIFIKSWMDKGITNTAIEKVKKDIK
jgi:3-methyladenine DNA glycosylase AlkD